VHAVPLDGGERARVRKVKRRNTRGGRSELAQPSMSFGSRQLAARSARCDDVKISVRLLVLNGPSCSAFNITLLVAPLVVEATKRWRKADQ
jgi:hypothetical protein